MLVFAVPMGTHSTADAARSAPERAGGRPEGQYRNARVQSVRQSGADNLLVQKGNASPWPLHDCILFDELTKHVLARA